jgi:hypothetical protein
MVCGIPYLWHRLHLYAIIHVVHRGLPGPAPKSIVLMDIDFAWERKDLGQKVCPEESGRRQDLAVCR